MGNRPYGLFQRIRLYLSFRRWAQSWRSIHSPLVFRIARSMSKSHQFRNDFKDVEKLRKQLLNKKEEIDVVDFGQDGKVIKRSIRDVVRLTAKSPVYGRVLASIVRELKPSTALELGTSVGLSLAYQMIASPNTTYYSIEGDKNLWKQANENIAQLGLRAFLHQGRFQDVLPGVLEQIEDVDFVFIDGHHQYQPTLDYLEIIYPSLSHEACIVFDDIYWSEGMQNAWSKIVADERFSLTVDAYHFGIVFKHDGTVKQHFMVKI